MYRLDFFPAEVPRTISHGKAPLGAAVDEVGGCAQVVFHVLIVFHILQGLGRTTIAVLTNELVDGLVLPKFFKRRRQNNQLGPVGQGHTGTVDARSEERRVGKECRYGWLAD